LQHRALSSATRSPYVSAEAGGLPAAARAGSA
jgi:hypothetical protein